MAYSKNTNNGVTIDYDLLARILDAKQERLNNPIEKDPNKYCSKVLSISKTVYPHS